MLALKISDMTVSQSSKKDLSYILKIQINQHVKDQDEIMQSQFLILEIWNNDANVLT
jgi:hypothetical protein